MNTQKGIAPIIIIALVVLASAGTFAIVERNVLKEYFEKGDKPSQEKRTELKDEFKNGDIPNEPDFVDGKKPTAADFADTIDSSLNLHDDGISDLKTPAKVLTEDKKEFSLSTAAPVTFRWTPHPTTPKESVTYRLKVWQLMQGQNSADAMKANKPIVTKDVENSLEVTVSGIYTGPCKPPYLCDFVWAIEALAPAAPPSDGGAGTSATTPTPASASAQTEQSTISGDGSITPPPPGTMSR